MLNNILIIIDWKIIQVYDEFQNNLIKTYCVYIVCSFNNFVYL